MAIDSKQQPNLLHELCERNVAVEFHRQTLAGELVMYRGRLLRENHETRTLEVEMPKSEWANKGLDPGDILTAYFVLENGVHSFLCEVHEKKRGIALNESKNVEGLVIQRLGEINTNQRRDAYRINLAGSNEINVSIHRATDTEPHASPIDAWRITGQVIESSATGLGIMVDQDLSDMIRAGEFAFVTFAATASEEAFCFLVEIRQIRTMFEDCKTRMGVKIMVWPERPVFGREIFRFGRFINDVERAHRKRVAG